MDFLVFSTFHTLQAVNDKKQTESTLIHLFRKHYPDFPKGSLKPTESPDFILSAAPRHKIGIELTSLHPISPGSELLSFENLSACLESKNDKLHLYRKKKLNEYWLVITLQDHLGWNRINLNNKLMVWDFKTEFDRVFLFNPANGKVFEMNHG
jgi:hypothetical protein